MTYTRRLTVALRSRGAKEGLIADVVRETHGLQLRDEALERELGAPEDYARELVPETSRKRSVGPVLIGGLVAAAVWVALVLADGPAGWGLRDTLGPLTLVPAVVLLFLGVVGQFASDYFRRARG